MRKLVSFLQTQKPENVNEMCGNNSERLKFNIRMKMKSSSDDDIDKKR